MRGLSKQESIALGLKVLTGYCTRNGVLSNAIFKRGILHREYQNPYPFTSATIPPDIIPAGRFNPPIHEFPAPNNPAQKAAAVTPPRSPRPPRTHLPSPIRRLPLRSQKDLRRTLHRQARSKRDSRQRHRPTQARPGADSRPKRRPVRRGAQGQWRNLDHRLHQHQSPRSRRQPQPRLHRLSLAHPRRRQRPGAVVVSGDPHRLALRWNHLQPRPDMARSCWPPPSPTKRAPTPPLHLRSTPARSPAKAARPSKEQAAPSPRPSTRHGFNPSTSSTRNRISLTIPSVRSRECSASSPIR